MTLPIISTILTIVAFLIILWIIIRKTPILAMIQLESIPSERDLKVRHRIAEGRFNRLLARLAQRLRIWAEPIEALLRACAARMTRFVKEFERHTIKKEGPMDPQRVVQDLALADELFVAEQYAAAEKKYIEIIAHDPKQVKAYVGLGALYIETKELLGAHEVFAHALKLDPSELSAYMGLGKVQELMGHLEDAFATYQDALAVEPNNPRLLDSFIDTAILLQRRESAEVGIKRLASVNPENEKVKEFWGRLREL